MAAKPKYVESVPRPFVSCCFVGCQNNANVRLWTKTGWANVCARVSALEIGTFHYEQVEQVARITHNPHLDEIRKAYAAKMARRTKQREPGSDDEPALGISLDALECELAERMNP